MAGLGARQRLRMISQGLYPNSARRIAIGQPRTPTEPEISSIKSNQTAWNTAQPRSRINKWKRLAKAAELTPSRANILEAYGLNEESLKARTAGLAAMDARRKPQQLPAPPPPILAQSTDNPAAGALHGDLGLDAV